MKKLNILELRQSLSKALEILNKTGEPILLEKSRKPAAVIISLEDFQKRFVDVNAHEHRLEIEQAILSMARTSKTKKAAVDILRKERGE